MVVVEAKGMEGVVVIEWNKGGVDDKGQLEKCLHNVNISYFISYVLNQMKPIHWTLSNYREDLEKNKSYPEKHFHIKSKLNSLNQIARSR